MGIRIMLVDDHTLVRHGVKALLESQEGFDVVGEAENGREAVIKVRELIPDVVIMDIAMPVLNGIEATRQIKKEFPAVRVIALSMYTDDDYIYKVLKAGASGYVVKSAPAPELFAAVRSASAGNPFFSPVISRKMMENYLKDDSAKEQSRGQENLTSREREVLQLVAEGNTNNEVAQSLEISVKTVETHRAHIMSKLGLRDVGGLIRYAVKHGMVMLESKRKPSDTV